jgi:hypothetical protein
MPGTEVNSQWAKNIAKSPAKVNLPYNETQFPPDQTHFNTKQKSKKSRYLQSCYFRFPVPEVSFIPFTPFRGVHFYFSYISGDTSMNLPKTKINTVDGIMRFFPVHSSFQ